MNAEINYYLSFNKIIINMNIVLFKSYEINNPLCSPLIKINLNTFKKK